MKTKLVLIIALAIYASIEKANSQAWNLSGNAGTNATSNFIGTTDSKALKFRTNNAVRMTISSGGKIGIGTTSPVFKLDVKGGSINTDSVYRIGGNTVLMSAEIFNTFVGNTGNITNTGHANTATGTSALYSNTTGTNNTATGANALKSNTSGGQNTATGYGSLFLNTTGSGNVAIGTSTLFDNTTGNYNTAIGNGAIENTATSEYNTAVGTFAGYYHDHGYNNVFVGANTGVNAPGYYNAIAIGQGTAVTSGVSTARFGNAATVSYGGWAGWTNVSDGRYKKNVKENVPGIEFISKLRPVTYTLAATELDAFLHKNSPLNMSEEGKKYYDKALSEKEKITYTGFIAQEVEASAKDLEFNFSGVDAARNENDVYGLRYAEFVVPLVKAVQELNAELKMQNAELKNVNTELIKRIEVLESKAAIENAYLNLNLLEQNTPNPFSEKSVIRFNIPASSQNAALRIYSADGKEIKSFMISEKGTGQIEITDSTLEAGIYNYTLFIDGKAIDSKQMVLTK